MNDFQLTLFHDLEKLIHTNEAFFVRTQELNNKIYKIYNYRLASYTDFLLPNALNCRGTMFEVDKDNNPIRLASLPINKFFNVAENPFTMNLNFEDIEFIEDKLDGSLISSYMDEDQVRLKSKGALLSEQAVAATQWLDQPEQHKYKQQVLNITKQGFTVDFEWVSPTNRIVLGYDKSQLIMLHIRNNETGELIHFYDNHNMSQYVDVSKVFHYPPVDIRNVTLTEFIKQVPDMTGIEGYVVKFKSGLYAKLKTLWYLHLHTNRSNIANPKCLFEVIISEGVDDLLSLFVDDTSLVNHIRSEQIRINHLYNQMISSVEDFYNTNKDLSRKEFAILGQQTLPKPHFGLAMCLYLGQDVNYKQFVLKNYELFM